MNQLAFHLREPWLPADFSLTALNEKELRVYEALYFHQGSAAAVPIDELAYEAFPFKAKSARERETRDMLKSLTEERGVAVASSCRPPYGAYLITEPDELLTYTGNLTARAMSMLRRISKLKKISLPALLGQLSIEEGK